MKSVYTKRQTKYRYDLTELDLAIADTPSEDLPDLTQDLEYEENILEWCFDILSSSPTARLMIAEAEKEGWRISLGSHDKYDFHLDIPERHIILNVDSAVAGGSELSDYFKNALLVSLTRALRDIWQEKRHGGFDANYGPEEMLMLSRVRAADCDVISIYVAWELRGEGYPQFWRHILGSDLGDIAMVFSQYLERDPSSLFNGRALAAAFDQWYQDEDRVDSCDHETLEYIDCVIAEEKESGYAAFGQKRLSPVGLEVLSCMPDKTAYLRGQGGMILRDPYYSGMGDAINQAHMMQILKDMSVTYVQDVPFRSVALAEKIFPGGQFTDDASEEM